ncbi:MAG: hypothetical protein E4G94_10415 [ANME-2 cluster archaeon]|nr:MAG: hypothetical protein E4G94_10415 [ANME-2 cluster archaeon]
MRTARSLVVLIIILSVMFLVAPLASASDWQMVQHDSRNTGYTNETVPDEMELLWESYDPRGWSERFFEMIFPGLTMMITTDPLVADEKVFVIFNSELHAIDADTGKKIWSYDPSFGGIWPPIAIADGKVFVSFEKIYAFDADRGEIIWTFEDTGYIYMAVADGKIFVSSRDKIYCLDEDTGNLIRSYEIADPPAIAIIADPPAIAEGKIFVKSKISVQSYLFSMQEGIIEELEEELNKSDIPEVPVPDDLKMEFRKNNISLRNYMIGKSIKEDGEWEIIEFDKQVINGEEMSIEKFILKKEDGKLNIYAKCRPAHKIYVLDEDSGKIIWSYEIGKYPLPTTTSIAIADGKVFFGSSGGSEDDESEDSKIYGLDADTGDLIWSYYIARNISGISRYDYMPSSIAVAPGKVFVGTKGNKIYALDADTGNLIWSHEIEKGVWSVAIADKKVFVGGGGEKIYCLDADTGDLIRSYKLEEGIQSIAIADEKVFVGSGDEKIYCFGAKEEKGVSGFETILAIAGLLAVAYLFRRRR